MNILSYSLAFGAISAAISIGLGAFAAHGLKAHVNEYKLDIFNLAAEYQMIHALALIACGMVARYHSTKYLQLTAWFFILGSFLFCGSLYALALGIKGVGIITPLGGLCFIAGWLCLSIHSWPKSLQK